MCSAAGSSRGDTSEAWLEHVGDLLGDFALLCACSARAASSGSALAISMARLDTERLGGMLTESPSISSLVELVKSSSANSLVDLLHSYSATNLASMAKEE